MSTILKLNNPGAIEDGPFARSQPGYAGSGGRFARFKSPQDGVRAQENLLRKNYSGLSPIQVVDKYAPGKENAHARENYIHYISKRAGVDASKPVPPEKIPALAAAMREFETGQGKKNVGSPKKGSYYVSASQFTGDVMGAIDAGPKEFEVGAPTPGEVKNVEAGGNFPIANPGNPDTQAIASDVSEVSAAQRNYTTFLQNAIEPIRANAQAVVEEKKSIAQTKQNIVDDFSTRQKALEQKIIPLQAQREKLLARLNEIDSLSPLDRRFKSAFNSDWDPRVIRGRLERVQQQIDGHSQSYAELNTLRSGVAALMVDADNADIEVLDAQARGILAESNMLGQVASAVSGNLDKALLPYEVQARLLSLGEVAKKKILGNMTFEMVTKAYNDASASPDGTVTIDGVKLTVGELQDAARVAQGQEINFRSLKNAYSVQDIETANMIESQLIDHMTPEQIDEALKNGGMYNGQQLSVAKLTQAAGNTAALREKKVSDIVKQTTVGQVSGFMRQTADAMRDARGRITEMFGNEPGEFTALNNAIHSEVVAWSKGFENAKAQGVEQDYIVQTMPQINSFRQRLDSTITSIATKWGGGKKELSAVAENYIRGNPISGDAALNGLIIIARSGMPAGAKLSGPAQAALNAARAEVLAWDAGPDAKAGDSIEKLLAGGNAQKKEDLLRKVQNAVSAVYADSITNELLTRLPDMAKNANHPFSQVPKEDFIRAVRHGDNEGFERIGRELGLDMVQTRRMLAEGPGGATWAAVKKAKGFDDSQFDDILQSVQSSQMTGLLQALEAQQRGSGKSFVEFMQSTAVQNQVDSLVNGYGRSSFGAYLVSSSAGGGYREQWGAYAEGLGAAYSALTSTELREKIRQQRSSLGDPMTRMNAVTRAAGLSPQEAKLLADSIQPLVRREKNQNPITNVLGFGATIHDRGTTFDEIGVIIKNGKLEDPTAEKLRQRVARNWDEMESVISAIEESIR